jgi:hypothetical protein
MRLAPCATCGSSELDARVVYPPGTDEHLMHVICKSCSQEWVECHTTFFEIGGHVIENEVVSRDMPGRPLSTDLNRIAKQTGVPAPLLRQGSREIQKSTGYDPVRAVGAYGRLRRARWAATTAGILAAADGPLPIGDALAIGFLGAYSIYEVGMAISDIRQ